MVDPFHNLASEAFATELSDYVSFAGARILVEHLIQNGKATPELLEHLFRLHHAGRKRVRTPLDGELSHWVPSALIILTQERPLARKKAYRALRESLDPSFYSKVCTLIHYLKLALETFESRDLFSDGPSEEEGEASTLEKLKASELLFKLSSRSTRNLIWDYNPIDDTKTWNDSIRTELGYELTPEIYSKEWWLTRVHPEDRPRVLALLQEAAENKAETLDGEYRFQKSDGSYAIFVDRASMIYNEANECIRIIGVMEDVTAERMAVKQLQESEKLWRTLTNSMSQIAWMSDLAGNVQWFNDRYYQFTGQSEEESLGKGWLKAIHPDFRSMLAAGRLDRMSQSRGWEETFPMRGKDGEYRYFLATARPIRDEEGCVRLWVGTNTDVTRQLQLTDQIREREEHLRIATEAAHIGTWTMDLTSQEGVWSKKAAAIHGFAERRTFTTEEAVMLVHPDDRHILIRENKLALDNHRPCAFEIEFRILRPDGSIRWVALSAKKLEELNPRHGSRVFLVGTLLDLTDRVAVQNELEKARDAAESANAAKTAFLANMSHEIRTPLGAILGFTNLLKDERYSQSERIDFIETIGRAGLALTRIIDDILDLSKIEAGAIRLETVTFSLRDLIQESVGLFSETARKKDIAIGVSITRNVPQVIGSDAARIRQILINLIGNAVKFTKAGTIQIEAFSVPVRRASGSLDIQIDVKDSGIGISEANRSRLFQPFTQIDDSTTRTYGGTGLGLALSKRLALALGGDISVGPSPGQAGCTFSLVFPAEVPEEQNAIGTGLPPHPAQSASIDEVHIEGVRILVAEDSPEIQFLLQNILSEAGASVAIAKNGKEAIEGVRREAFDVILMDIQMPLVDGYEATRRIRADGFRGTIIAVTAHAMAEERQRTREAGCDQHLTKPLDPALLLSTIQRSVRLGPSA